MVLICDGNSEIGAHVESNLCYLICLRHLIRSKAVTNRIYFSPETLFFFLHGCAICSKLSSYISTMEEIACKSAIGSKFKPIEMRWRCVLSRVSDPGYNGPDPNPIIEKKRFTSDPAPKKNGLDLLEKIQNRIQCIDMIRIRNLGKPLSGSEHF